MDSVEQQMLFLAEIDNLKGVLRQVLLHDASRRENTAEHSWHLATAVLILSSHIDKTNFNLARAIEMALIHDIVEIDADDTFAYDDVGRESKKDREKRAAERIFALLPESQAKQLHSLWNEFEAQTTLEARFVSAIDRLLPLIGNFRTQGHAWKKHGVLAAQVYKRIEPISSVSTSLGDYARGLVDESVRLGYLKP